jgi:hypothetical protein
MQQVEEARTAFETIQELLGTGRIGQEGLESLSRITDETP